MITEDLTPLPLVRQWTNLITNVYDDLEATAVEYRKMDDVRLSTESELAAALSIINAWSPPQTTQAEKAHAAYDLYCCAMWRKHKVVYAFDPTLASELVQQADDWDDTSALPIEALEHPPYKCCFISAPGAVHPDFIGFFPFVLYEIAGDGAVLALTAIYKERSGELGAHTELLHLDGATVGECIDSTYRAAERVPHDPNSKISFDRQTNLRLVNLYLYICAQNAEIAPTPAPTYRPRTKGAPIRDRFREVQSYDTGMVIGSALRRAAVSRHSHTSSEPTGRHVRAHTRRGHWHHFWTGSKSLPDDRKIVLKWVSPVLVGGKDNPEVTTVYPVKE